MIIAIDRINCLEPFLIEIEIILEFVIGKMPSSRPHKDGREKVYVIMKCLNFFEACSGQPMKSFLAEPIIDLADEAFFSFDFFEFDAVVRHTYPAISRQFGK